MANNESCLLLEPPQELVFRGPFIGRTVCELFLTNTSNMYVAFKMKCNAAQYYASNPAVGVISPKGSSMISVYLSELDEHNLAEIDYRKHRFGISYLPLSGRSTANDVDRILKGAPKNAVKIAYLRSVILAAEGKQSQPQLPPAAPAPAVLPTRDRLQSDGSSVSIENGNKPVPPKPAAKPIRRMPSEVDYQQELQLKDSVITEMQKEKDELTIVNEEKERLIAELRRNFQEEKEAILRREQALEKFVTELAEENERVKREQLEKADISFWEVSQRDLQINEHIGHGAWGYVARGLYKEQEVAIKCVHKNIVSPHTTMLLKREVTMMAKVRHPCLLLFIAVCFDHPSGSPMIITELMECSLRDAYKKKGMLSGRSKIRIMIDVACALHYLHTHKEKILHRDVSSANVLVHQTVENVYRGKLSDFGSANVAHLAVTAGTGAALYMAPEVPRDSGAHFTSTVRQTTKIDVYSYGILLCEVFATEPQLPFAEVIPSMRGSIKKQFSFMHDQVLKCTSQNPEDRPDIIDVLCELRTKFAPILN